ncbi:hypothetical protein Tco_1166902 [Tanacetum coccineum]
MVRVATTASSLEAEQDSGNIAKTQSKATPNESSSLGTTLGGGPRRQETMGDTIAQTRFENVSKHSSDTLIARGNTLRSGEDSLKLNELMELCTNLQTRVLDLEKTKTTQAEEIVSLKRRVKKLKQKKRSRTHGLKRLYKVSLTARVESSRDEESLGEDASKLGRINAINADEDITLVNDQDDVDMFDVNTFISDKVLAEQEVATKDVNLTVDEVTLTQALAALKSVKPKVKANVVEEPSVPVIASSYCFQYKGTSTITTTISSQPSQLQAEFNKEERLVREKDEANVALTEEWDDIQAKVDDDYQLAQRLVNMFIDYRTDLVEGSSKRAGDKLEQEVAKKQKVDDVQETTEVDDDQEATKIKEIMEIVPDGEEVSIDAIPLAIKPPTILSMKKLDDFEDKYQVSGRIVGIKSFLMLFGITTVLIDVNAAQSKLVLLENFNENYSKCQRLLEVKTARESYYC